MNFDDFFKIDNEKPLDRITENGGYTAIFRTVCCIGDSLSSGEFEATAPDGSHTYHDMYEYSWGQFIGRMCGSTVYNFSRGGMTAKEYCESFASKMGFWDEKYASQCYILALGVNDLFFSGIEAGSLEDIDPENEENNKATFAGYMGRIVSRMKKIQPRAKFFLVTMPRQADGPSRVKAKEKHSELMYQMAELFDNTYVIDLYKYAPVYDEKFNEKFKLLGHLNPMGYLLTARIIASYIDYIIRHNPDDFKEVGFIGTDLHA